MIPLDDIQMRIRAERELTLNEDTLGESLFALVKKLLKGPARLRVTKCALEEVDGEHLRCAGEFVSVFGWKGVRTEFSLFDRLSARNGRVRDSVFSIEIPESVTPDTYLSEYIGEPDDDSPPGWTAVTPLLVDYFRNIAFEGKMMLFSSIDYSRRENEGAFYPEVYRTLMPASQVKAGMNFLVKVAYTAEVAGFFADVFARDNRFRALLEAESPNKPLLLLRQSRA